MGGKHAAWAFADEGSAQAAAEAAAEFCRRYCPIGHRCAGPECRVFRYQQAAHERLAVFRGEPALTVDA